MAKHSYSQWLLGFDQVDQSNRKPAKFNYSAANSTDHTREDQLLDFGPSTDSIQTKRKHRISEDKDTLTGLASKTTLVGRNVSLTSSRLTTRQLSIYSSSYGYGLVNAATAVGKATGQGTLASVADLGGNDTGLDIVNAPEAWAAGYTGKGVVVAVVDTGVDYNHTDLNGNIWVNTGEIPRNGLDDDGNGFVDDTQGWDFVDGDNTPMDLNSHGTHVAGSIAAENNGFGATGVAYDAKIMPVRVLDESGSGSNTDVAAGIVYAADNGANVINLSLGGGFSGEVEAAVQYAENKGAVVVMAAGNDGKSVPDSPARVSIRKGVAVGAVNGNRKQTQFSNKSGKTSLDYVVAPGINIYSTVLDNSYNSYTGTSMSTAYVSGVAALIRGANSSLTATQVESILATTATHQA